MNIEAARRAAQNATKRVLEDTELNELIEVTEFVHMYLQERGEHLISISLFNELRSFKRMKDVRSEDTNMGDCRVII